MMSLKTQSIIAALLGILLGALFIFSAWTKTYPIEDFDYIIASQLHLSNSVAALLARAVIGTEFALGVFLLLHFILKKKWVVTSAILLLLVLTAHLVILYYNLGNDANCGCMGSVIPMKPLPSILKNIVIIALLVSLYKTTHGSSKIPIKQIFLVALTLLSMGIIYLIFPPKKASEFLSYHKLYQDTTFLQPNAKLLEGKHILSLMTLGCGHCRDAAKEMVAIKKQYPDMPFYFLIKSPRDSAVRVAAEKDFMDDTQAQDIPFSYVNDEVFMQYLSECDNIGTPVILWMKDSSIIREVPNHNINANDLKTWLDQ